MEKNIACKQYTNLCGNIVRPINEAALTLMANGVHSEAN